MTKRLRCYKIFNIVTWTVILVLMSYIIKTSIDLLSNNNTKTILFNRIEEYTASLIIKILNKEILDFQGEDGVITKVSANTQNIYDIMDEDLYTENDENIESENAIEENEQNKKVNNQKDELSDAKETTITINNDFLNNYKVNEKLIANNLKKIKTLKEQQDYKYLLNNFYIVDSSTSVTQSLMNVKSMLNKDMTIKKNKKLPQILIYHTHSTEKYIDSRNGKEEDTIVGVGSYLANILEKKYGYKVLHNKTAYDVVNGSWNRHAYNTALPSIKKILEENESIEVVIDLHRNSGTKKEITTINGVNLAKIMFFNGVSRTTASTRDNIINKNILQNLAFGLQLEIEAMSNYQNFAKKIYIKGYRYNMHLCEKTTLIEVGNDKNTVKEAYNAMQPLAKVLDGVLNKE